MRPTLRHLAAALLLGTSTATLAAPPPWAPAHGHRAKAHKTVVHHYVYYPTREVYYAPDRGLWFWIDAGDWRAGIELPRQYVSVTTRDGVRIELADERPYRHHHEVRRRHPRR